jgi:hypothetical protein
MNSLRAADNKARSVASGTAIDGEDPGDDSMSIKDLLKNAKSFLNRREYMTAVAFLGRFHKKFGEIIKIFNALNLDVDKVHHDFLFKDLDDEHKKHLNDMKGRLASTQYTLVSEASIMDFLVNVGTQRGRALAAWEKRYPKQVSKLKKDIDNLYDKSDLAMRHILSTLKEMAKNRATRKVDDYMKEAGKMSSIYSNYDNLFKEFYNTNVKGFLEKQELIAPTKTVEKSEDLGKQEVVAPKSNSIPDLDVPASPAKSVEFSMNPSVKLPSIVPPSQPQMSFKSTLPAPGEMPPAGSPELAPQKLPTNLGPATPTRDTLPSEPDVSPDTERDIHPEIFPKSAHQKFWNSLQVMSNEKPELLKSHILKYARSIKSADPITAIKLLNIAKDIKG